MRDLSVTEFSHVSGGGTASNDVLAAAAVVGYIAAGEFTIPATIAVSLVLIGIQMANSGM